MQHTNEIETLDFENDSVEVRFLKIKVESLQHQNNNLKYNCELKDEQIYNERFRFGLIILFLTDLFLYSVVSNALAVCSLTVLEVLLFLHVFHTESKEFINRSLKDIFTPFKRR